MRSSWHVVNGDVAVPVDEAEWWGASLAILVAAVHHPHLLVGRQPHTDAAVVAREVLKGLDELRDVARRAEGDTQSDTDVAWGRASVCRAGNRIVFSPGAEVSNFAWCLLVFALAVLDSGCAEAAIARDATAYAASAWSREIGEASGSLKKSPPRRSLEWEV